MPIERMVAAQVRSNCARSLRFPSREPGTTRHVIPLSLLKTSEWTQPRIKMGAAFPKSPNVCLLYLNQQQVSLFLGICHEVG